MRECRCENGAKETPAPQAAQSHGSQVARQEQAPQATSGSSGSNTMLFAVFGLAILFGGYMVLGILAPANAGTCESGNIGACPLDNSITAGGSQGSGGAAAGAVNSNSGSAGGIQDIYIRALSSGTYDKSQIQVNKGVPVRLHFSADPNVGCGRQLIIYGMNVKALSRNGEENIVSFTPDKAGTFEYNCGMRMFRGGRLVVA